MSTINADAPTLNFDDISRVTARYILNIAPSISSSLCGSDVEAPVFASQLLKDAVDKALEDGINGEMLAYHIFMFAESVTIATMTEVPQEALASTKLYFDQFVDGVTRDAKECRPD